MPESTQNKSTNPRKAAKPKAAAPRKRTSAKATAKKVGTRKSTAATKQNLSTASTAKNEDVIEQALDMAKGAAYTAVGFGIMAFGKAQVTAREVRTAVTKNSSDIAKRDWSEDVDRISETVRSNARKADTRVESVITNVEKKVEAYEHQLPGKTRDLVKKARTTGQDARGKVRAKVFTS